MGLTLGKSTDYRDTHDASLLQGVPRSLSRDPLDLKADNLSSRGTDIWMLHEPSWLNARGSPQVTIGYVELDYASVDLIGPKSFKLYLNSFNQTRFNNQDEMRQTLKRDLSTCVQGKVNVMLYRLDELESQPIGRLNDICIDDQDIAIDNYGSTTDYLENATSGEKVVKEMLASHLLKSNCPTTHRPGWGSIQVQYCGRQIGREKLPRYLVFFHYHNEFHKQCVERIFNDLLRLCQSEELSVYARYTRCGGLDINPRRSNNDFAPSTTGLARQ